MGRERKTEEEGDGSGGGDGGRWKIIKIKEN